MYEYTIEGVKAEIKRVKKDPSITEDEMEDILTSLYCKLGDLEAIEAERRYLNGGDE